MSLYSIVKKGRSLSGFNDWGSHWKIDCFDNMIIHNVIKKETYVWMKDQKHAFRKNM